MQGVALLDYQNAVQRKKKIQVAVFTAVVLVVLLGITFALFDRERRQAETRFQDLFDSRVSDTLNRISDSLDLFGGVLRGFQGFYSGSDKVTRTDFRNYVSRLEVERNLPGVLGIGFALAVRSDAELEQTSTDIRAEGFPRFQVVPRNPMRDFYTPIVFLEPLSGRNLRAFGFDMFSEQTRRHAMERAWLQDSIALSGKVRLVQEDAEKPQAGAVAPDYS